MHHYAIRRLTMGEANLYREIRLESLQDSPGAFATTLESALERDEHSWISQADGSSMGNDRATFVVIADRPIGLAALYRHQADPASGDLIQMWIAPFYRGQSVATDLLNHVFNWAASHDFSSIRAEVTTGNQRALRCYLKYGFLMDVGNVGEATRLTKAVEPHLPT